MARNLFKLTVDTIRGPLFWDWYANEAAALAAFKESVFSSGLLEETETQAV